MQFLSHLNKNDSFLNLQKRLTRTSASRAACTGDLRRKANYTNWVQIIRLPFCKERNIRSTSHPSVGQPANLPKQKFDKNAPNICQNYWKTKIPIFCWWWKSQKKIWLWWLFSKQFYQFVTFLLFLNESQISTSVIFSRFLSFHKAVKDSKTTKVQISYKLNCFGNLSQDAFDEDGRVNKRLKAYVADKAKSNTSKGENDLQKSIFKMRFPIK